MDENYPRLFGFRVCYILYTSFLVGFYNIAHNAVYPFFGQYNWNECHDKHFILVCGLCVLKSENEAQMR